MNSKPVEALDVVEGDIEAAVRHYSSWRTDARRHFLDLYDEAAKWISWDPDLFSQKFGVVQRVILRKSYYILYYIQEKDRSLVIAVLDGRTDPKTIMRLLRARKKLITS